jgi:hypothetical protein
MLFVGLVIEDAFKSVGGDPFIGRRLGTLLLDAGFERIEVAAGYSPAISNVAATAAWCLGRLSDAAFCARVVRRGWISAEQLADMPAAISAWRDSPAAVVGVAECMGLGWKT